ncbi:nuclear transport factor 2 family protein [Corallincola holothuriorum]|uniref:Nuclear transport factor 2 family protein n=4 Tax=Psychromonadaceae TaxID=267894 RepID=A0A368NR43_9GAMM|nr:nuclear transport factor 2 family protein [Corallincola holothuriorum]TAA48183.1 nuclear transport factor 2 family protein [Corallincola spongiicola]
MRRPVNERWRSIKESMMQPYLKRFETLFTNLTVDSLAQLDSIYTEEVVFKDPAHTVEGLDALTAYFSGLCNDLTHCRFEIFERAFNDNVCFLQWQMSFSHPKLQQGKEILVPGCSVLKFNDNGIYQHTDFFDMGTMLYEQVPLLGGVVNFLKRRLAA